MKAIFDKRPLNRARVAIIHEQPDVPVVAYLDESVLSDEGVLYIRRLRQPTWDLPLAIDTWTVDGAASFRGVA